MAEGDRERWDAKYRSGSHRAAPPPQWLAEFQGEWRRGGRALDVAAGSGRVARWLASKGLDTLAIDVSPVGLEGAERAASAEGHPITTHVADLEREPLPTGPFDVITCFHYLQRELFPEMCERLASGGFLFCEIATRRNLERHSRPSERFLLETNELLRLCSPLEVAYYREAWIEGQFLARIAARQPAA